MLTENYIKQFEEWVKGLPKEDYYKVSKIFVQHCPETVHTSERLCCSLLYRYLKAHELLDGLFWIKDRTKERIQNTNDEIAVMGYELEQVIIEDRDWNLGKVIYETKKDFLRDGLEGRNGIVEAFRKLDIMNKKRLYK